MKWHFRIWSNGSTIDVPTQFEDYFAAISYLDRLYGDDYIVVSQETK